MSFTSIKQQYLAPLSTLHTLVQEEFLPEQCAGMIQELIDEMQAFRFTLSLAGKFSAGKSTLLNAWIGQEIQPVDLTACTTLATEFHYVPEKQLEKCIFYPKPTHEHDQPLPTTISLDAYRTQVNQNKLDFNTLARIELHLNTPHLARYADLILVDTPGLGSTNGLHDAALKHYCGTTTAFILCVTRQSLIGQEERDFLLRQRQLGQEIFLLVCQEDLTLPLERKAIRDTIRTQSGLPLTHPVYGCSAFDPEIGLNEFEQILQYCTDKKEHFFVSRFQFKLQALLQQISALLTIALGDHTTLAALKAEQRNITQGIQQLTHTLEQQEAKLRREAAGHLKDRVIMMVDQYLRARHHTYVEHLLNQQEIQYLLEADIQQGLSLALEQVLPEAFQSINATINQQLITMNTSLQHEALHFSSESTLFEHAAQHLAQKGVGMLLQKLPLPAIILPPGMLLTIASLLTKWVFGLFRAHKKRQEADNHIKQTLDQVINLLKTKVPAMIQENVNLFIQELKTNFETQLNMKQAMLEKITAELQTKEQVISDRKQKANQAYTQLQQFMQEHFSVD